MFLEYVKLKMKQAWYFSQFKWCHADASAELLHFITNWMLFLKGVKLSFSFLTEICASGASYTFIPFHYTCGIYNFQKSC